MGAGSLDYVRLANDLNLIRGPGKSGDPAVAAAAQILPPPVRWAQDLPSPLPWERAEPHTGASDAAGVAGDTGDTGERLWPGSWEAAPACRFGALVQVGGRNAALQQCFPDPPQSGSHTWAGPNEGEQDYQSVPPGRDLASADFAILHHTHPIPIIPPP
ncbi:hypothetical protein A1Q2_08010 [Trichosporon asahii var. asahii CBS 8904]|uniref:Uncharacterized protein n=2 Tax=Trichosporon asahii var. asahii TaxID=189963 RepID=K1W7T2_TRIAC|nr:hypothetical protein A1Q1_01976 [Trichosporon asahii var. asahii CBS 2479]EJT48940.1 hypothetical protein A1Q1_01976 [Trichosporon asahii var. asahii CBS 2479]EKC97698.1 hypothetical protein A1Q2_08010 [Trichosporon asahii var. asahii CBS 8904]